MKKIMHYYTSPNAVGGPLTYINTIIDSELSDEYLFSTCFQNKKVSKLKVKDYRRIVNEIKKFNPDILHIHGLQGEGFVGVLCGKLAKCSHILMTVHGMQNDSVITSRLKRIFYRQIIEKFSLRNSDYVYCVCEAAEKNPYIYRNVRGALLPFVWNCVRPLPNYDREEIRRKFGYDDGDFVIISVGRITKMKGCFVLESVIKNDQNPTHKYLVVGDGVAADEMKSDLSDEINSGKVKFVGKQNEIGMYLSCADTFVSASLKENLSIAILEAGYYALPCVVTDVGGNTEIVNGGECGILVPVNDSHAIAEALNRLNDVKYRETIGAGIKDRVDRFFSKEVFIRNLNQVYKKIAED